MLACPLFSAPTRSTKAQARTEYDRASRLRTTLESQPESARSKADYEKVINVFRSVYRADPAFSKSPTSVEAVAELYEQMGRRFSDKHYFQTSIGAYDFLIKQYPDSPFSRDAILAMAEIYRTDLEDQVQAQETLKKYLQLYPKSKRAAEARAALKESQQLSMRDAAERSTTAESSNVTPVQTEIRRSGKALEVTSVRHWVGPNYTRIVISVEGEVGFDASRLVSPDRLVFDISNARPSPELAGKTFPVADGFLRQIRVAAYKPNVTRVVLDVARIEDYSVFSLPNPFRLVIDIHGAPAQLTAKDGAKKSTKPGGTTTTVADNSKPAGKTTPPAGTTIQADDQPITVSTTDNSTGTQPTEVAETTNADSHAASSKKTRERAANSDDDSTPIKTPPPTENGSRTLTRALGLKIGRIVIDPGHGGHDTGTIGPTGEMEKDVVLDVGLRLAKLLEQDAGSEVLMTRRDDTFIPLEERTAVANEKAADLFISIHANASRDEDARGIETYYLNFSSNPEALEVAARENATSQQSVHELRDLIKKIALTEKVEESRDFATEVQREVHSRLVKAGNKQKDRGVKKAPFVVLIGANMPSILAEISFLTNPKDERLLKQPEYRQKIAQALYQGVIHYVNNLGGVKVAQDRHPSRHTSDGGAPAETSAREVVPPIPPNF
jgi:N-acetylmuramoyl-L-alanine amidase